MHGILSLFFLFLFPVPGILSSDMKKQLIIRMVEGWHSQTRRQLQRKRGIEAIAAETTNSFNLTCTLRLMKRVFFFLSSQVI